MRFGVLVGAIEEDEIGGRKKSSCNKTRVVVRKRNRAGRIATCYKCRKKQLLVPGFGQYLLISLPILLDRIKGGSVSSFQVSPTVIFFKIGTLVVWPAVDLSAERRNLINLDRFGYMYPVVVRNVRIQRRVLWYFAGTPKPCISTALPSSILIRLKCRVDIESL